MLTAPCAGFRALPFLGRAKGLPIRQICPILAPQADRRPDAGSGGAANRIMRQAFSWLIALAERRRRCSEDHHAACGRAVLLLGPRAFPTLCLPASLDRPNSAPSHVMDRASAHPGSHGHVQAARQSERRGGFRRLSPMLTLRAEDSFRPPKPQAETSAMKGLSAIGGSLWPEQDL